MRIRYIDDSYGEQICEVKGYTVISDSHFEKDYNFLNIKESLHLINELDIFSLSKVINIKGFSSFCCKDTSISFDVPFYLSDGFVVDESTVICLAYVREFTICSEDFNRDSFYGVRAGLYELLSEISVAVYKYNTDIDKYSENFGDCKFAPHAPHLDDYLVDINNKIRTKSLSVFRNGSLSLYDNLYDEIEDVYQREKFNFDFYKTELLEKGYLDLTTLPSRVNPESKSRIVGYIVRR